MSLLHSKRSNKGSWRYCIQLFVLVGSSDIDRDGEKAVKTDGHNSCIWRGSQYRWCVSVVLHLKDQQSVDELCWQQSERHREKAGGYKRRKQGKIQGIVYKSHLKLQIEIEP